VTGSEAPLTVYARDEFTKALAIAYVWHVHQRPRFFLLSYSEALGVLGEQRVCMPAWESYGYWHITNVYPERQRQMAPFEDRWEWLRNRLDEYGGRVSY